MALSDMYQVTHKMTQQGQTILSVYHAERASAAEEAQEINDAFANSILPILKLQQVTTIVSVEVTSFNLATTTDFHTQDLSGNDGLRAAAASPTFISGAVRFPTLDRAVRSGHKRFCGMAELDYTDGVLSATAIGLLEDVADALIANWLANVDSHIVCSYAIIKRVCDETDPITGKCTKYRLPETDGELVFYEPTSRLVNSDVSSQVSRKVF